MKNKMLTFWYNYRTKEIDYLFESPDDYEDYIPQDVSSQKLYQIYRVQGLTKPEAAREVLKTWVAI